MVTRGGIQAGAALGPLTKHVTQEQVQRYAEASGDHNPIHLDAEFAARTPYGRRVAHGMLTLAFVSELLMQAFGRAWAESGKLRVRFKGAVVPGQRVTVSGRVRRVQAGPEGTTVECAVSVHADDGSEVLAGEAWVTTR
ncbi:MAG: MaoC family dehydratase [Chloroflexi bacterium]|nr:MaoC family dehydratase [Chloroflexota bacterium]